MNETDATGDADPRSPRFEAPENANEKAVERIERVNEILDSGKVAKIEFDGARGRRATFVYDDRENEQVLLSPDVYDGRAYHGFGYGIDPSHNAFAPWVVIAGWSDPVTAVDLEETPLHHAAYGTKEPTVYVEPDD